MSAPPRRILITGAGRGIGAYLARYYADRGDLVVGCSRHDADFHHDRYEHMQADVTSADGVRRMMKEIRARWGGLDVVINNAGAAAMNLIALTPPESARQVIDTNLLGTFTVTREAIRLLRRTSAGRIVNMTSVAVPLRLDGEAIYAAAKSAVETFTRITAREVGGFGITCNAVGPSPIRTSLLSGVPEATLSTLIARQSVPRWAVHEDVANVVDFFLKPESAMVTGQVVYLGGLG